MFLVKKYMFENLRNRPDHEKKKIALIMAGAISAVILVVWATSIYKGAVQSARETKEDGFAFWGELKENMASSYQVMKERVGAVKNQFGEIKERTESLQQTQTEQVE